VKEITIIFTNITHEHEGSSIMAKTKKIRATKQRTRDYVRKMIRRRISN